ncbi:MAG: BREX system ATP-binding domain-containing protein, partial [Candidatus Paceibacteria bacterium]
QGGIQVEHYKGEEYVDFGDVIAGAASYLHGGETSLSQLWAIGKNGHSHISKENEYEYLKGLRSLSLELGYEGIVVLIDEFAEEEMSWNPDEDTEKRLIDLVNKCYNEREFTNMMFVFVGNRVKWDDLIESAESNGGGGHEALRHRYDAGKLELGTLNKDDYAELVKCVGTIVEIGYDIELSLPPSACHGLVDEAVSNYDSTKKLSPRGLLLDPLKEDKDLIELLRERYETEDGGGEDVY